MKNEITYTQINGINYPNLALPEQPKVNIGKYRRMQLAELAGIHYSCKYSKNKRIKTELRIDHGS